MDLQIILLLGQDGVTNGAIYALLALALVLVFSVTRVIFIPQGELVAFGALSMAALGTGKVPGTLWLLLVLAVAVLLLELWRARRGAVVEWRATLLVVAPLGPLRYRLAYRPLARASVLILLIVSVALHGVLVGLGLLFFG